MGNVLQACTREDDRPHSRKITHVPIFQIPETMRVITEATYDNFYYIPKEDQIDRAIDYLDEIPNLTEKDNTLLSELLGELWDLRTRYGPCMVTKNGLDNTIDFGNASIHVDRTQDVVIPKSRNNIANLKAWTNSRAKIAKVPTIHTSILDKDFAKVVSPKQNKPSVMIEIQSAKFLHAEMIKKYTLENPYVLIKVYTRGTSSRYVHIPKEKEELFRVMTSINLEIKNPIWDEYFEHQLDMDEETKDKKFGLYYVGVSLYYTRADLKEEWQVGEEQMFSLTSLMDQKLREKVIDYKDPVMKGVLARLKIKLQLIHDVVEAKEKIVREIDTRMEKLENIQKKHRPNKDASQHYLPKDSFMNPTRNDHSMLSFYSQNDGEDDSNHYYMA